MSGATYKFHPLADLFPFMDGPAFDDLVADIKTNGLRVGMVLYQGLIIDGRNRYRACLKAGVEPRYTQFLGDDDAARRFVISANVHRRHLTPEQKRWFLEELIKADPTKSNRVIAAEAKISPTTVGAVRKDLESTVQIGQLKRTIGKDGKSRPAKRAAKPEAKVPRAEQFNVVLNFLLQYGVNVSPANVPAVAMKNDDLERVVRWLDSLLKYRREQDDHFRKVERDMNAGLAHIPIGPSS